MRGGRGRDGDEGKGGIHVNTKIYKVTHYTNTRMVLNSLEVTLGILHVIDNTMQMQTTQCSCICRQH